jgi:spermidine synthase
MGDPYCAQINRFYTMEFFKAVKGVLKKQGIVSFALSSSESYINSQLRDFLASIHAAVKGVFRDVKVFPGDKAYFLACDEEGLLTYDYRILTQRADARRLDVRYVREYYLFARLSRYNVSYIKNILDVKRPVVTNRDFQPASYLYATVFWASRFKDSLFIKMFKFTNRRNLWLAVFIFCGGIFILALTGMPGLGRSYKQVASTAIMATGFSQMAFQVLVLLLFQIIWGYLYYKLGFILTSFMIGLAIAGLYMVRVMPRIKNAMAVLALLQSAVCVYFLMLPPLSYWLAGTRVYFVGWLGSNLVFPFLSMLAGIIGGLQFPLANYIYLGKGRKAGRAGGITYGIDLMGSCLGALLTSAFLIPVLGITNTCLAISLINAAVAYLLIKMS